MVVGLAGKYCSGKSLASEIFRARGFFTIDVDRLGHEALVRLKDEAAAAFGKGILTPAGEIDRRALGAVVFKDRRKLRLLESIVHPWMKDRTAGLIKENPGKNIVVNAALLFPLGLEGLCDRIVVVEAPLLARIRRGLERDRLGLLSVLRRIQSQRKLIPQPSLRPADTIIVENRGTPEEFRGRIDMLISGLFG